MAKKAYGGVSDLSKNGIKIYGGVNNLSKKIVSGYVGVGNKSKRFWPPGPPIYETYVIFENGEFFNVYDDFDFSDYHEYIGEKWDNYLYDRVTFNSFADAYNVVWLHSANLFDIDPNIEWTIKDIKIDSGYDVNMVDPYLMNEIIFKISLRFSSPYHNLCCKITYYGNIELSTYTMGGYSEPYYLSKIQHIMLNSPEDEVTEYEFQLHKSRTGYTEQFYFIGINAAMNDYFNPSSNKWIYDNVNPNSGRFGVNRAYCQYGYPLNSGGWEIREYELVRTTQVDTVFAICFRNYYYSSSYNDNKHHLMLLLSKGPFTLKFREYRNSSVYKEEDYSSNQKIYDSEIFYIFVYYPKPSSSSWQSINIDSWYPYRGWEVTKSTGFDDESKIVRFCYEFLNSIQQILWSQQVVKLEIIDKDKYV